MRKFGLIGYPLSHSFSKKYFTLKFEKEGLNNCSYELLPLKTIEKLPVLIQDMPELEGINVTIPYKEKIFKYLDVIEHEANLVGAINTIKIEKGKLIGYNTDIFGFEKSLVIFLENIKKRKPKNALILGTGGASKAVKYVLQKMKIDFKIVSREKNRGDYTYSQLNKEIIRHHKLIINTTPLGMYPKIENFPDIPYEYLTEKYFLFDLVYNPKKTVFLKKGEEKGCAINNGLEMLYLQADEAWRLWQS